MTTNMPTRPPLAREHEAGHEADGLDEYSDEVQAMRSVQEALRYVEIARADVARMYARLDGASPVLESQWNALTALAKGQHQCRKSLREMGEALQVQGVLPGFGPQDE